MFEFRENSQFVIIMNFYYLEHISEVNIAYDEYVIVWEQILDELKHLHAKKIIHRDLKLENILMKKNSLFKIIIVDFGFANVAIETRLLKTFCDTSHYATLEMYSDMSSDYESLVNIFFLDVMIYEWIYALSDLSSRSASRMKHIWLDEWIDQFLNKLKDEEDDSIIKILTCMIEIKIIFRWSATKCLSEDFKRRLFKKRIANDLIEFTNDSNDLNLFAAECAKTVTTTS